MKPMRPMALKRLAPLIALAVAGGVMAAVAFAEQPKADGTYGGTFNNGKNYVSFYARKSGTVQFPNLQYRCKGKNVAASASPNLKPRKIAADGSFVIAYKARIVTSDGNAPRKVASGRARIEGRFVSSTHVKGTARVRSKKCPKRKRGFLARGP